MRSAPLSPLDVRRGYTLRLRRAKPLDALIRRLVLLVDDNRYRMRPQACTGSFPSKHNGVAALQYVVDPPNPRGTGGRRGGNDFPAIVEHVHVDRLGTAEQWIGLIVVDRAAYCEASPGCRSSTREAWLAVVEEYTVNEGFNVSDDAQEAVAIGIPRTFATAGTRALLKEHTVHEELNVAHDTRESVSVHVVERTRRWTPQ